MHNQPLFSALVANYNNGKYIAGCLDSILAQDYPNIEIIIVDDGSTDDSTHVVDAYLKQHDNISFFKNEKNYGTGYTKKRCIDLARGEICGFVDSDDKITTDAVTEMCLAHQSNADASLIYSNMFTCDEQLNIIKLKKKQQVVQNSIGFLNEEGYISHFSSFKKKAYLNAKGLNTTLKRADDIDLYLKLYDVGKVVWLDKDLYYYRIHQKGVSSLENTEKAIFERWKIIFNRAEEKGINIEDYFLKTFIRREQVAYLLKIDTFIKSTWLFKLIKKCFN